MKFLSPTRARGADAGHSDTPVEKTAEQIAAEEAAAAAQRDTDGAVLDKVADEGAITTASGLVLTPVDVPVIDPAGWEDVLIVANGPDRSPPKKDRKVIVAEARSQSDAEGGPGQFVVTDYPKNADAYVGYAQVDEEGEARRIFGDVSAPVYLVGQNVKQFGLNGVSRQHGYLSVGPGHPVYVAVNLALQLGAKTVEVHGLTDYDKSTLGLWLDKIVSEFDTLSY